MSYRVIIDVEVTDEQMLFEAACTNYVDQNDLSNSAPREAREMFRPGGDIDVPACLIQLFDPGHSPDGTQIQGSEVES